MVRTTTLPSGEPLPVLGLGTWRMAEDARCRDDELSALRLGLDLGLALLWCQARRLPIMAYSPIEQGRLLGHPSLRAVAAASRRSSR